MKVNEIILEGPISQTWQGIKSAFTKGGSYAGGVERAKGQERINKIVTDALPYWFKTQAAYQQRGIDAKQMGQYLTQWARQRFSSSSIPEYSAQVKDFVDDAGVKKYLQIAASYYLASELGAAPAAPDTSENEPAADSTSASRWGSITRQLGDQPQQTQLAAKPAINSIFQDPAAFSAEFNEYIQGIGGAQQASTELKNTLKAMWASLSSVK